MGKLTLTSFRPASVGDMAWIATAALLVAACGNGAVVANAEADAAPVDAASDEPPDAGAHEAGEPPASGRLKESPPLAPRTVIEGMSDFDFTNRTLAVRIGQSFFTCTLPECRSLVEVTNTTGHNGRFAVAGDQLYFSARAPGSIQDNVFSIDFDGTNRQNRTNHVVEGPRTQSYLGVMSFAGGLGRVEQIVSWSRFNDRGYRTLVEVTSGVSANPYRVGRTTSNSHENDGSIVRYFPEQMKLVVTEQNPERLVIPPSMTVTGATVPVPTRDPERIATSARGPGVLHPMVVIRDAGALRACPTRTSCSAWIELGAIGPVYDLDDENLYFGGASGLSRCALSEIDERKTCTPRPMAPRELVEPPLYLTEDAVVFKSGGSIRAVAKSQGGTCPLGQGTTESGCVTCATGEEPSPTSGRCERCPLGTFAERPGVRACTACEPFTSTVATGSTSASACTPCPPGERSSALTAHQCVPITWRRVFLTVETHDGNFANDAALSGENAIEKADAFCMASTSRPDRAVFKAVLVDGVHRDAAGIDWVLAPNALYVRVDGSTPLGRTDASGVLPLPLPNPWEAGRPGTSPYFYTGIGASSWATAPAGTCLGWSSASFDDHGNMGASDRATATSLGVGSASPCATPRRLLCAEQ